MFLAGREICTPEAFATAYKAVPFVYSGIPAIKITRFLEILKLNEKIP